MTVISDSDKSATTLRTASRALAFLEIVALAPRPPKLKDVTTELGLNVTTGYHMLNTLRQAGYLVRDSDSTLRIGARAAMLYQGMLRHFVLGRDLHPIVEQLSRTTHETAYLCSASRDGVVVQALVDGNQAVGVTGLYIGFSGSEHIRASGKAVLAFMPEADRTAILTRAISGLPDRDQTQVMTELESELTSVRRRGWALDDRKFQDSVCCVAAPFFSINDTVAGSIAVSVPATRFFDRQDDLVAAIQDAGRLVSETLGCQPIARD